MSQVPLGPNAYTGYIRPGFEAVGAEFASNLTERGDQGAAFAAVLDGKVVIDIWGGTQDARRSIPWKRQTVAGIYSGTKGLTAMCVALLVERGEIDVDAPVSRYWPEFGRRGKRSITVAELMSHRGGLAGLQTPVTHSEATDAGRMAALLADQTPIRLGAFSYHALTFGWLCGELIHRVDGRTIGSMLKEEFADRLGLDIWIGVPPEQDQRIAWTEIQDVGQMQVGDPAGAELVEGSYEWSVWRNPPRVATQPLPANVREWRAAEIAASNGVATARSMATLYSTLVATDSTQSPLSEQTLRVVTRPLTDAVEPTLATRMAFGFGFQLQANYEPFGPFNKAFGHAGAGGSVHGACLASRLGFSYVTRSLDLSQKDRRAHALLTALSRALSEEGDEPSFRSS